MIYILWTDITVISVEYPASLLQGWKTFPKTVNDNIIKSIFCLLTYAQIKLFKVTVSLTEFGALA